MADLVNLDFIEFQDFIDLLNFENLANQGCSISLSRLTSQAGSP